MRRKPDKPSRKPRPSRKIGHPSRKRLGEAIEAAFLARVSAFNFDVARPWGECNPFDFLVGLGPRFWRVQVKCTQRFAEGRYRVKATGWRDSYTPDDIDFIAAHIVPENIWYIIPIEACAYKKGLRFYPQAQAKGRKSKGQYENYREAWCLLTVGKRAGKTTLPKKCRCPQLPIRCATCPRKCETQKCGTDTLVRRR